MRTNYSQGLVPKEWQFKRIKMAFNPRELIGRIDIHIYAMFESLFRAKFKKGTQSKHPKSY